MEAEESRQLAAQVVLKNVESSLQTRDVLLEVRHRVSLEVYRVSLKVYRVCSSNLKSKRLIKIRTFINDLQVAYEVYSMSCPMLSEDLQLTTSEYQNIGVFRPTNRT